MARDIPGYYFGLLIDVLILIHQASHLQLTVRQIPRKANISRLSQTMLYQVQPSTRNRQWMHGGLPSKCVERSPATTRGVLAGPIGPDICARALRRKIYDREQTRQLREKVLRSRLLDHPLMNRLRIRNATTGIRSSRFNVTTEIAAYYGASLSRTTLLDYQDARRHFTKFAIDEPTAAMVTATTGSHNLVVHHTHSPWTPITPYTSNTCVNISAADSPVSALLITPRPANYIMWAVSATGSAPGTIRLVPFGQEPITVAARRPEDRAFMPTNYDNMGISYTIPESDIWDMAASASGRRVVAACTSGLCIFGEPDYGLGSSMRKANDREFMAVSFKDENVVFGGTRSGTVRMVDLRSLAGTVRLRHGSGVTAVRALSNDNYVVIRGLETMSTYDLRYVPLSKSLSKPYVTFQGSYASDRFGLGFDYDPVLGLIATAHSSPAAAAAPAASAGHRISLFSTQTGRIVPSHLNSYSFPAPVTCIQFTNAIRTRSCISYEERYREDVLADDGRPRENNEPKSIVTASGGLIDEWSVQGLGVENARQE